MRRAVIWVLVLASAAAAHAGPLAIGDAMPRIGQLGTLGDSGALVVFHSRSCESSLAAEPELITLGNSATQRLVRTTIVDLDGTGGPALQREAAARGIHFAYVDDAKRATARAFGAVTTPEAFLFDGGGHLVYHGALASLSEALEAMLARQPITTAQTEPAGCPIRASE